MGQKAGVYWAYSWSDEVIATCLGDTQGLEAYAPT